MKQLFSFSFFICLAIFSKSRACSCPDIVPSFCEVLTDAKLSQELVIIEKNDTIAFAKVLHTITGKFVSDTIKLKIYPKVYHTYIDPKTNLSVTEIIYNSCGFSEAGHSAYPVGDTLLASIYETEIKGIYGINHNICSVNFQYKKDGIYSALGNCPINAVLGNDKLMSGEQVSLFPNPSSETIYLNKNTNFSIYSAIGENLGNYRDTKEINLSSFKRGLYILKEEDTLSPQTIKFVLE